MIFNFIIPYDSISLLIVICISFRVPCIGDLNTLNFYIRQSETEPSAEIVTRHASCVVIL